MKFLFLNWSLQISLQNTCKLAKDLAKDNQKTTISMHATLHIPFSQYYLQIFQNIFQVSGLNPRFAMLFLNTKPSKAFRMESTHLNWKFITTCIPFQWPQKSNFHNFLNEHLPHFPFLFFEALKEPSIKQSERMVSFINNYRKEERNCVIFENSFPQALLKRWISRHKFSIREF